MKVFYSALFVFAVFGATFASPIDTSGSDEDWSIEDLHQLKRETLTRAEKLIEEVLLEMGVTFCAEANIDLTGPMQEVKERIKAVDTESETVCALVKDHIEQVFEPLTTAVDECGKVGRLGPVATSTVNTIKSVFSYICSITGEQILELVNPCLESINIEDSQCGKQFDNEFNQISPETSSGTFVEAMCGILPSGKTCVTGEIAKHCHLDITKNTWAGLLDALLVACH